MTIYLVGGAVRDRLMGLPSGDRDWLVVGATVADMLQQGFIPVGHDFPVFLHPVTKEEYALARTERKVAKGYKGFQFYTGIDVTLEQDLSRRDLTINAIAQDENGGLHDPFQGQQDIQHKILRHVSAAFVEDPVRILRLARFAARFGDFSIAPETLTLCRQMVANGETQALVPERVWKELSRALCMPYPSRFFAVLQDIGVDLMAQQPLCIERLDTIPASFDLAQRWAVLTLPAEPQAWQATLPVPKAVAELATLVQYLYHAPAQTIPQQLDILLRGDAIRRPERFAQAMQVRQWLQPHEDGSQWMAQLQCLQQLPYAQIAHQSPQAVKEAIYQAQLAALQALSNSPCNDDYSR